MTRFARAKGSKSSNERVPEEATPWNQMKQQLLEKSKYILENQNRQDAINQRTANYKAFIEERELEESKKSQWAQFSTDDVQKTPVHLKNKTKKPHYLVDDESELSDNDENFVALKAKVDEVLKKSENSKISDDNDSDAPPEEESSKVQLKAPSPKVKKVKKKKLSIAINTNTSSNETDNVEAKTILKKRKKKTNNEDGESKKSKTSGNIESTNNKTKGNKKGKKQKGKIEPTKIVKENLTEQDIKKLEKKKQRRIKQIEKKKLVKAELKKKKEEEEERKLADGATANSLELNLENGNKQKFIPQNENYENGGKFEKSNTFNNRTEKKPPKPRDDKKHNRKKPQLPNKMFINGKEVEIDYVDGFPVKKEDAERLKKLRKEMISKGLPRSEINIALKLERRRAEKAFTREKKKVCFNCRKSGHNLSECPDLEKGQFAQTGTGICFKCGSTEHTHFECKVVRTQDFKYAQCFICNEQGHIARQCPDNSRGLYPKGGSCKVCGDVTHLKRDCPKYQAQQQQLQSSYNAESIGDKPDELDNTNNSSNFRVSDKRPNKVIKF